MHDYSYKLLMTQGMNLLGMEIKLWGILIDMPL